MFNYSVWNKRKKLIFTSVFITLLNACSSVFTSNVQEDDFYSLQPVPAILVDRSILESVVFKSNESQKLLTQIEYHENSINMVAMTYSGLPIVQAKWEQGLGVVDLVSSQFDQPLVLQFIRDIQWVKWPKNLINDGLSSDYLLSETLEENQRVRQIKHKEHVIVKITYTQNRVVLENKAEHYELVIEQLNDK